MISTESKPGNPYIKYEGYIGFAAKVAETKLQLSSITVSHNFLNIFHMAFKYSGTPTKWVPRFSITPNNLSAYAEHSQFNTC